MDLNRRLKQAGCIWCPDISDLAEVRRIGTITGNPIPVGSPAGRGLTFDADASEYINFDNTGDDTRFDATASYLTVMAWVKVTRGVYSKAIVSRDGITAGWHTYVNADEQFAMTSKGGGMNAVTISNTDAVSLNTWNHMAVSFIIDTATIGNNLGTMYVNGDKTNTTRAEGVNPVVSSVSLQVASRGGSDSSEMEGSIARPMIFARQLSDAEILSFAEGRPF